MTWQAVVLKILIASPSDVPDERAALPDVLNVWNSIYGEHYGVVFQPVMWETHSRPTMGEAPQTALNAQIVDTCDGVIATFWTRLGTETENAASGTVEEIERCIEAGKPVMVYFSNAPVRLDSIDTAEYGRLKAFREECQTRGLYDVYESVGQLREKVGRHLTLLAKEVGGSRGTDAALDTTAVAQRVDPAIVEQYRRFASEIGAEWRAEKASDPVSSDRARAILGTAFSGLVTFAGSHAISGDDALRDTVDSLLARIRAVQNHPLYLDGGVSWRAFWNLGDEVMNDIGDLESALRDVTK